jgi:hypothetical protein
LVLGGMTQAQAVDCDYGFHAMVIASPEDLAFQLENS